jgi:hypothetical protein
MKPPGAALGKKKHRMFSSKELSAGKKSSRT